MSQPSIKLKQGHVVRIELSDPNGANGKVRPAVVLTRDDEISADGTIVVAAISSTFSANDPDASFYVSLPWALPRHPKTGLSKASVVKCRWLREIEVAAVVEVLGYLPGRQLLDVIQNVNRLKGG